MREMNATKNKTIEDRYCTVEENHPLFQLAGIFSHEEAQKIRSEKMGFSGA